MVTRGYELAVSPSGWERSERRRKASLFPEECERGDDICRLQRVTSFPRELVSRHYERIRTVSMRTDFNAYEFLKSDSVLRSRDSALADAEIAAWDREMQDELARRRNEAAFTVQLAQRQRLVGTGIYALMVALGAASLFLSLFSFWHWSAARSAT